MNMTSVRKINQAISEVRGLPFSNVDTYTRKLKDEGIFPAAGRGRGGSKLNPEHAALALFAIMRGSPVNAAQNATEVGELKPHADGGGMSTPVLEAKLQAIGWTKDTTLSEAVADIITRVANGKINELFGLQPGGRPSGFALKVDKYWTQASLCWYPTLEIIQAWEDGCGLISENIRSAYKPERLGNGYLGSPMRIGFHSPLLRQQELTYSVDREGNRTASNDYMRLREERSKFDLHGTESVSLVTIEALAKLFENDGD